MSANGSDNPIRPLPERAAAMALTVGSIASAALMLAVLVWKLAAGEIAGQCNPAILTILGTLGAGLFAGFCGSILGVGGGFFAVPFLVLVLGLRFHYAAAASIILVIATSSAATPKYLRRGFANMGLGMAFQLTAVVGATAGTLLVVMVKGEDEVWLSRAFAVVLLAGAYLLWRRAHERFQSVGNGEDLGTLGNNYYDPARKEQVSYRVKRLPGALALSVIGGATSSLGLGGGTVNVPVMRLLCGTPIRVATTTSTYIMGLTSATAAFLMYVHGDVVALIAVPMALGALAGSRLGAVASHYLHGRWIQYSFVGVMVAVAARMLWGNARLAAAGGAELCAGSMRWDEALLSLFRGQWSALPDVAMLLLMLTPVASVVTVLVVALCQRTWRLVAVSAGVLAVLAASILISVYG